MGFKVVPETRMQAHVAGVPGDLVVDLAVEEFTAEDVEHIDDAICDLRSTSNATACPGLEWLRNKVAARVGVTLRDEGTISYKDLRADDEET